MGKTDRTLTVATRACGALSACVIILVFVFLIRESWTALTSISWQRFFTDRQWYPLSNQYSMLPMVLATTISSCGALLIAAPLGVASALFSTCYAPSVIVVAYRRLIELLAGIPSVVYGLWGLVVLVPMIARFGGSGQSLLAATLVLAMMILPTTALTATAALQSVPSELIRGGAALGLDRWGIIRRIALPFAARGIRAGLLLALCRAIGETMAVMMVAGNVVNVPQSLLAPVRTLTANIALEMGYATDQHRSVLFVSGLLLMTVVAVLMLLVEFIGSSRRASV